MHRQLGVLLLVALLLTLGSTACRKKKEPVAAEAAPALETATPATRKDASAPPRVDKVSITPSEPKTTDTLQAEASAVDGASVTVRFQWYLNGEKLVGEIGDSLPSSRTRHGDSVEVEATANRGAAQGPPLRSGPVTIRNSAPQLLSQLSGGMSLDGFRMQVSDVDEDPITYRLEGAPPNMSVDSSGVLHWKPQPTDKGGEYEVTLTAEDGQGGDVKIRFPVRVTPPVPAH